MPTCIYTRLMFYSLPVVTEVPYTLASLLPVLLDERFSNLKFQPNANIKLGMFSFEPLHK
jgi:hypothetical protein